MAEQIKFGTDGWRGIIADDFTFENVRRAAGAIASYCLKNEDWQKGIVVGYDTRFGSDRFARAAAEVIAAAGIPVRLSKDHLPTPAVSYAVKLYGCAGGVAITSSHNPWNWNGVKFKANFGGSATPAIIKKIEGELGQMPKSTKPAQISEVDLKKPYIDALTKFVDLDSIAKAKFKFAIDAMHGSGRGILAGIFKQHGIDYVEIRGDVNPLFPGINPEPIQPHVQALQDATVAHKCAAGFATDGDADRIGAVAEDGSFVDSHKIYSILLRWLLERKKWPGEVVRAYNTTKMLDRISAKNGRKLHETGIGFKFICDLMLTREIVIGGEESGGIGIPKHLPERDGVLNSLLLAQVMADEKKTLKQLVDSLQQDFGPHYYGRRDLHIANDIKESAIRRATAGLDKIGNYKVKETGTLDGVKFYLDAPQNGTKEMPGAEAWVLIRASGTEPLLRIYAEASTPELVTEILDAAVAFVHQNAEKAVG